MIEPFGIPNNDHPSISSLGDGPMVSVSNLRVAAKRPSLEHDRVPCEALNLPFCSSPLPSSDRLVRSICPDQKPPFTRPSPRSTTVSSGFFTESHRHRVVEPATPDR